MKRPLCLFAVVFFIVQIICFLMPQQAVLPIAAIFAFALISSFAFLYKRKKYSIILLIAACLVSLVYHNIYLKCVSIPQTKIIGISSKVVAHVDAIYEINSNISNAVLTIKNSDSFDYKNFKVLVRLVPNVDVGEYLKLNLTFKKLLPIEANFNYSDGVFIAADFDGGCELLEKRSLFYYFNKAKTILSKSFMSNTGEEVGAIGSAMAFGDKSKITGEIKSSFKAAGLSHMLVVSGMHLAAVSGIIFVVLSFLLKSRRIKAVFSIILIIAFVLLTGITASSVRAAVMLCIVYLGMCFNRRHDSITSLCTALLILTIQNPFIIHDIGFLLSFSSTVGIIIGNVFVNSFSKHNFFIKRKIALKAITLIMVPISATLATIPVLITFNMGISVLGVLFNVIAVPFLPIIVSFVFLTSILALLPILQFITNLFALATSCFIGFVFTVTKISISVPFSMIHINGAAYAVMYLLILLMIFIGFKYKIKASLLCIISCFLLCFAIINGLQKDVIYIKALNSTQNAAIAVYYKNQCAVILREKNSDYEYISEFLKENNLELIQMVSLFKADENIRNLGASTIYDSENSLYGYAINVFNDIIINIKKQSNSCAVVIDIKGFKIALNKGTYNFENIGQVDIFIAGKSKAENISAKRIIVNNGLPKWLKDKNFQYIQTAKSEILVRKGKSYKINEGYYGLN